MWLSCRRTGFTEVSSCNATPGRLSGILRPPTCKGGGAPEDLLKTPSPSCKAGGRDRGSTPDRLGRRGTAFRALGRSTDAVLAVCRGTAVPFDAHGRLGTGPLIWPNDGSKVEAAYGGGT